MKAGSDPDSESDGDNDAAVLRVQLCSGLCVMEECLSACKRREQPGQNGGVVRWLCFFKRGASRALL